MGRKLVFNPAQPMVPSGDSNTTFFYSSDPTIQLEETNGTITLAGQEQSLGLRNTTQRVALVGKALSDTNSLFGDALDWAYRQYIVHNLSGPVQPGRISDRPAQPVTSRAPQQSPTAEDGHFLYLCNVIVALEWLPTRETLSRLEWAFRRASDFLYDVTNGWMAFGQVIFADVSWMECADIQILASNRFLPRSWVSGLLDPDKYTPIRVGRGVWIRDRQLEVPWDEPEGYRALVHEWGHYALGLKDKYITTLPVNNEGNDLLTRRDGSGDDVIVVPLRRIVSESIMATVEGNSEFEPVRRQQKSHINVNGKLFVSFYPGLKQQLDQRIPGPGRLPLPLPCFRYAGEIIKEPTNSSERTITIPRELTPPIPLNEDGIPEEGWMLYLIRPDLSRIVPQGEIDARAFAKDLRTGAQEGDTQGFKLLGAEGGDMVVLIGRQPDGKPIVRVGQLQGNNGSYTVNWKPAAGQGFAAIDIVPRPTQGKKASAQVEVNPSEANPIVFSLYGDRKDPVNGLFDLPSLDGYVLTGTQDSWMISDFSKGGPPNSAPNIVSDFIAAGAASGDAVLFFNEEAPDTVVSTKYDNIQVVVTTLRGVTLGKDDQDQEWQALGPVYSIATTAALPADTNPTLLIVTPLRSELDITRLRICRLEQQSTVPLPTFFSNGPTFAATPLKDSGLSKPGGPWVERYVLAERVAAPASTAATLAGVSTPVAESAQP